MKFSTLDITTFEDFRIGNAEDRGRGTGCTVIISEKGAVGGVDVRGGGPATRETDILRSENTAEAINAVVLSGGSALGLEAASGVTRELAEHGIGFRLGDAVIPLVCGASLFDLNIGNHKAFPDVAMGIEATRNAFSGRFRNGNSGAGTGASVGKILGIRRAMKSGLGTFACGDGEREKERSGRRNSWNDRRRLHRIGVQSRAQGENEGSRQSDQRGVQQDQSV